MGFITDIVEAEFDIKYGFICSGCLGDDSWFSAPGKEGWVLVCVSDCFVENSGVDTGFAGELEFQCWEFIQ